MPRTQNLLFVGIYNSVLAVDPRDGAELWRTKIGGTSFVNVYWDGEQLFATTKGEVFCLDPRSGEVTWQNKLKGLGMGLVSLASTRAPNTSSVASMAEADRMARAQHAASTAT